MENYGKSSKTNFACAIPWTFERENSDYKSSSLQHRYQSLFTFFLVEETSNLRKTATCKCCEKKIEFIPGSTVFSSYTLILKSHLQSHPEQFNLYLELLAKNMKPDNKTKFQHFCRMEYPALLPKPERGRRWDESRLH